MKIPQLKTSYLTSLASSLAIAGFILTMVGEPTSSAVVSDPSAGLTAISQSVVPPTTSETTQAFTVTGKTNQVITVSPNGVVSVSKNTSTSTTPAPQPIADPSPTTDATPAPTSPPTDPTPPTPTPTDLTPAPNPNPAPICSGCGQIKQPDASTSRFSCAMYCANYIPGL